MAEPELSCCAAIAAALESMYELEGPLDVIEGDDIVFSHSIGSEDSSDLGRVHASVSLPAYELIVIRPLSKRIRSGAKLRLRITSRVRRKSDSCFEASFKGIARIIRAQIEK
jgi:hypothetical protein